MQPTFRGRDHRIRSGASISEVFEEGVDLPQEQQVQDLGSLHHNLFDEKRGVNSLSIRTKEEEQTDTQQKQNTAPRAG